MSLIRLAAMIYSRLMLNRIRIPGNQDFNQLSEVKMAVERGRRTAKGIMSYVG